MELDLETLTAKSDWVGVSNILKRQVYTWGALFLLTIGLLVASIVNHHKVIVAAITTAFMAYRFIKVYRLYRVFKDSVRTDDEEHVDIDELRRLTKEFLDCHYQEFDSSTTVFEITEAYKSALERGKSQGFYPVLVPVSENNFIGLTAEIDPDGPCYSVDMKKVRAWRRNMLATAVTDGHKKIDELLADSKADIEQDGSLDWRKDIIGECEEKLEEGTVSLSGLIIHFCPITTFCWQKFREACLGSFCMVAVLRRQLRHRRHRPHGRGKVLV